MKRAENYVSDITIAYIGGGSRGWAWNLMADLALEKRLSGEVRLYDIDLESARQNEKIGNSLVPPGGRKSRWRYKVSVNLEEALRGADFVIISILPGTFKEMETDVHMPERLGIYQAVGDTVGPGGIIRALRTIPMFAEIAEAVKQHSPNAWVINYTNPLSLCVKTLYQVFPGIKAFGCCHEVFGTQELLSGILEEIRGITGVQREDIIVNVMGINHFTWFDSASYKGIDLFPVFEEYIMRNDGRGFIDANNPYAGSVFDCKHLVKFDLFKTYGCIAAAGDRHLAEFMPGNLYLKNPETAEQWGFKLTPVSWRTSDLSQKLEQSRRLASGEKKLKIAASGEEGTRLISALCGLERCVSNVNLPNRMNQIDNLPQTAIVETNAVFEKDALRPVHSGSLPDRILPLVKPHIENQELVYRAAMDKKCELTVRAFLNDPLVSARASKHQVESLVKEMIKATSTYLPPGWQV